MAVTEITKILFRRGTGSDRSELEAFGGLAQGEPGFTVVGDAASNPLTGNDTRSAFLKDQDMIRYDTTLGGGDLFVGGSEGKDVYIGGASAEAHWKHYFVSLRGTGFNRTFSSDTGDSVEPTGFVDGSFMVGRAGGPTNRADANDWNVMFFGHATDSQDYLYNGNTRGMWWRPIDESLEIWSNTALKIPVGRNNQRPGYSGGVFQNYTAQTGMIRFSSTDSTFEGYDGTSWGSLGGAADVANQTYITVKQSQPTWAQKHSSESQAVTGETGQIKFVVGVDDSGTRKGMLAGRFDNGRNLHVTQDIIAFSTSDERQKDNVQLIDNPTQKIASLDGVTFTWNDQAPTWTDDRDSREDVGLLAQQVEQVIPEAVTTRDDGYKAVDYKRVIPLLVESIKELAARVEQLESVK